MKYELTNKTYLDDQHCDYLSRLKMSQAFEFMQEGAMESAILGGLGRKEMIKNDLAFVLSRVTLEVKRIPKLYETLSITTWPKGLAKMFYLRDYLFTINDEVVIKGASVWAIINLKTRKIVIDQKSSKIFDVGEKKHALNYMPSKVRSKKNMELVNEFIAAYSLTDPNGHINNTRYIEWIYDVIPKELLEAETPYKVDINYVNEVYYKDKIKIYYSSEDNEIIIEGRVEEKVCFLAKFSLLE